MDWKFITLHDYKEHKIAKLESLTPFFVRDPYSFTVGLGAKRSMPKTWEKNGFFSAFKAVPKRGWELGTVKAEVEAIEAAATRANTFMMISVALNEFLTQNERKRMSEYSSKRTVCCGDTQRCWTHVATKIPYVYPAPGSQQQLYVRSVRVNSTCVCLGFSVFTSVPYVLYVVLYRCYCTDVPVV